MDEASLKKRWRISMLAFFFFEDLDNYHIGLAMLFSAGTFLYIATVDTLPDIHNPESGKKAMFHVLLGIIILTILPMVADTLDLGHQH